MGHSARFAVKCCQKVGKNLQRLAKMASSGQKLSIVAKATKATKKAKKGPKQPKMSICLTCQLFVNNYLSTWVPTLSNDPPHHQLEVTIACFSNRPPLNQRWTPTVVGHGGGS